MKPNALARHERLRSLTSVRRLFQHGEAGFVYPFRYLIFTEKSTSPDVEVLFSVPKRYHKRANRRNLLRRRTKEAYRLHKQALVEAVKRGDSSFDVALIYSAREALPYKTIKHAVVNILAELQKRC